jgi:hypothetical protein
VRAGHYERVCSCQSLGQHIAGQQLCFGACSVECFHYCFICFSTSAHVTSICDHWTASHPHRGCAFAGSLPSLACLCAPAPTAPTLSAAGRSLWTRQSLCLHGDALQSVEHAADTLGVM